MSINRRNFLKGSLFGAGMALTGFTSCSSVDKSETEAIVRECVEKGKKAVKKGITIKLRHRISLILHFMYAKQKSTIASFTENG